ncbi:MAG: phage tail protein [Deltaproteobacteria bacterium]|nr:phage tail protein [Deltaproteobacteria bacterium]
MMTIDIKSDLKRLAKMGRSMGKQAPKIMAAALNDTAKKTRTEVRKAVRTRYNVKAGRLNKALSTVKAKPQSLEAKVVARSQVIGLIHFGARPSRPAAEGARRPKKGVSFTVTRQAGRSMIPGSFVARMKSGHLGVYVRKGRARLPIQEKFGPAVPSMVGHEDVISQVAPRIDAILEANVRRRLNLALVKAGAK